MNKREKFRKKIISLIHGLHYDQAIKKEMINNSIIRITSYEENHSKVGAAEEVGTEEEQVPYLHIDNDIPTDESTDFAYLRLEIGGSEVTIYRDWQKREWSRDGYQTREDFNKYGIPDKDYDTKIIDFLGLPITIGRVIMAIGDCSFSFEENYVKIGQKIKWKIRNKDNSECTDYDQEEETISELLRFLEKSQ